MTNSSPRVSRFVLAQVLLVACSLLLCSLLFLLDHEVTGVGDLVRSENLPAKGMITVREMEKPAKITPTQTPVAPRFSA